MDEPRLSRMVGALERLGSSKLMEANKACRIRGKINVPRERFHSVSRGVCNWAGLQFR